MEKSIFTEKLRNFYVKRVSSIALMPVKKEHGIKTGEMNKVGTENMKL